MLTIPHDQIAIPYQGSILRALDPIPRPLDHLVSFGLVSDIALISRDQSLNYGALNTLVGKIAAALIAKGLEPGDRVATWLPKTVEACVMPLAAARAGLVHVPINPLLKRAQVAYILADSGARTLITAKGRADTLEAGDCPEGCLLWPEEALRETSQSAQPLPLSAHDPETLAAILYTSGSTGKPKGVMLSHANMWLGAMSVAHYLRLGPADRVLAVLPLSFDYGQNQLFSTWAASGAVVPLDYLLARDVAKAVDRYQITTLAGVPPLWLQLLDYDWPREVALRLRRITNSGGALTPALIERLRGHFPATNIYPMYGLTEAFRSTWLDPARVAAHPTSMGSAIPFAEILVVRADGSVADDDEPGELVHCGPLVAQGYWRDPERTAQRFRPAPPASRYGGTAVWSGDTVRRDAEGLLYFVGRDDEMIKVSGNRISPSEIEEAAAASGVAVEAVAFGVPDDRLGQAVILVVRGNAADESLLLAHLKRELPSYMIPREIFWRDALPRNANGKFDRGAIKAGVTP
jgi:acyl-CoA ligase (AMP-forming) (exosortase A-associated)